ncbi:biotin transporter BioY [Enemella dayhoffiae]|nr:biotin transporter BioY [Enemella dayhoffiae]
MTARSTSSTTDLALVAVFAALVSVLSLVPAVNVGIGVPITLQTLGVALCGLVLGPWRGCLAVLLYLVVGLVGLPVFAGGAAGIGVLGKPSAGYLLSFPVAALVAGLLARRLTRTRLPLLPALFLSGISASILIIHPSGILGLMVNAKMDLTKAAMTDLVFWPGDLVKNLLAAAIAAAVFKAFPALSAPRRVEPAVQ